MCSMERDNRGKDRAIAEATRREVQLAKPTPFYVTEFMSENIQLSLSIGNFFVKLKIKILQKFIKI